MTRPGIRLADIASCFEGVIPSPICTCAADGTPNVTYLSIVHRIDEDHVGLSAQFFNKTRRNVLENPRAQVMLIAGDTLDQYRLDIEFERTDTSGPMFDDMAMRIDAIASQSGMRDVFRLRGVDVYRVLDCQPIGLTSPTTPAEPAEHVLLKLAEYSAALAGSRDLESLLSTALESLERLFGYAHSFVMMRDGESPRLFTVASHGFATSGVGSEVAIGEGLIGMAAARRLPMRSTNLVRERLFQRVVREELTRTGDAGRLDREIPLPGLPDAQSQLVLPLEARGDLLGVLCVQSNVTGRFLAGDEPKMQILARHLAASMAVVGSEAADVTVAPGFSRKPETGSASLKPATIKYYLADDSVFVDDEYLIKGTPGRILHWMLRRYVDEQRCEFTNKELRVDSSLQLPEYHDNLEARLILLRKRLEERCDVVRIERAARGRLRLCVTRPVDLVIRA